MKTTARANIKQRLLWLIVVLLSAGFLLVPVRTESAPARNTMLTSLPLRLAIVPEEPSVAPAADLLTVELSQKDRLQLLERVELDKAYREQALSAANKDYLKLGGFLAPMACCC